MEILILIFFDWINLDARKASSPAGLSHPNGNWCVRNNQVYDEIINEIIQKVNSRSNRNTKLFEFFIWC